MPRKTQYEIAVDGLARAKVSEKTVNILNPGQRSDALVVFPTAGVRPSALFELRPPQTRNNNPVPNQPAQNSALAAILGLVQNAALGADPLPYNHDASYTATLGTVDEWKFGVFNGPPGTFAASHVYHIHVNLFEVMDITNTATNTSIFNPDGTCVDAEKTNSPMYCDQRDVFRDTIFIKPDYVITARTRYDDFIGEYVLHCHILDHEDQGMMMNVTIVNLPTLPPSSNPHALHAAAAPMPGMTKQ